MNSVETLLSKKMKEAEPALDIQRADRKVFQVAFQDFINYFKFNSKAVIVKTDSSDFREKMEQILMDEPVEFGSFLTVWIGIWLKKWRSRVKLLLGDQSQDSLRKVSRTLSSADPLWQKLECKNEMREMVISELIKNAEICGTEIIAEYLIKIELGKKNSQDMNNKEEVFAVLTSALRKAREVAQCSGPLIFVKVDKVYYDLINN